MPRPVKTDSKCPRYSYFRERYLAQKRQRKPSEPLPPDPFIPKKDICTMERIKALFRAAQTAKGESNDVAIC